MHIFIRRAAFVFLSACIVFTSSYSESAEQYDPQHTILALNMAAVSIHKIISTQDRITLYQEYNNIINNLAIGNIKNDREIVELYTEILNFIKSRTLRHDEEQIFRERYRKIQQRQFANSGLNVALSGGSMLVRFAADIFMNSRAKDAVKSERDARKKGSLWDAIAGVFGRASQSVERNYELDKLKPEKDPWYVTKSESKWGVGVELLLKGGGAVWDWGKSFFVKKSFSESILSVISSGPVIGIGLSAVQGIFNYFGASSIAEAEANRQLLMIEQENINNAARFLGGCSTVCISSYFDYSSSRAELLDDLDSITWRLKREDIEDCHRLQTKLLESAWHIMQSYHFPNEDRLTQDDIDYFCKAADESSPSARMRMFKRIEDKFKIYPPYWYYRGQTARAMNDKAETLYCFLKFDEIWRPVLSRDPYRAEIAKYKVAELSQAEGLYGIDILKGEIIKQLDILMKNITPNDWSNNNFAGLSYYAAGDKEKAILCIRNNIDSRVEQEISGALLRRIENSSMDITALNSELEYICLKNIIAGISDKETAEILVQYFHGDYAKIPALLKNVRKPEKNPVLLAVKYLSVRLLASSLEYENELDETLKNAEKLKEESGKSYAGILPILNFYLERNNDNAQILAGFMNFYGFGTANDVLRALDFFSSAAEKGNFYASYMAGLCCILREDYSGARKYFVMSVKSAEDFSLALFELGKIYSQGLGVKKDYRISAEYFKRAAECGHKRSQARLGDLYYEGGNNLPQSFYNAYVWYQVYEYDGSEEGVMSAAMSNIYLNMILMGGYFMGDETPAERIRLIEGYGWVNDPKLSDSQMVLARGDAREITHRITSKYKFLLVKDENSTAKKVIATASAAAGIILLILQSMR